MGSTPTDPNSQPLPEETLPPIPARVRALPRPADLTVESILGFEPKPCYSHEEIEDLAGGRTSAPLAEVLMLTEIPGADRLWLARRALPIEVYDDLWRTFAADCAQLALPIFEARYPGDDRPRRAIESARAYAAGEIPVADLQKSRLNACDAARDARDAARDAAADAADAAAENAARLVTRERQLKRLSEIVTSLEG